MPASTAPIVLSLRIGDRIYHVHRAAALNPVPQPSPRPKHPATFSDLTPRALVAMRGFMSRLARVRARPRGQDAVDGSGHAGSRHAVDALSQQPLTSAARGLALTHGGGRTQGDAGEIDPKQSNSDGSVVNVSALAPSQLQVPPGAPLGLTMGALTTLLQDASLPALMRALSVLEPAPTHAADGDNQETTLKLLSDPFIASLLGGIHHKATAAQALKESGLLKHFARHGIDPGMYNYPFPLYPQNSTSF